MNNSRYFLFTPLFIMFLFALIVLFLNPTMEKFATEDSEYENVVVIVFAAIALFDMGLLVPRMFLPKALSQDTEAEVIKFSLSPLIMTELPVFFGFILFFMYSSLIYFGVFLLFGFLSWFYFYRKITNRINQVKK